MPWEFFTSYAASKCLDTTIKTFLFSENLKNKLLRKGIAEKYLSLSAEQLISFYKNERPLDVALAGRRYVLPLSIVFESVNSSGSNILCEIKNDLFSVPEKIVSYIKPVKAVLEKDKKSFDGKVTRLSSFRENIITLQEASYYDGVATNFAVDHCPNGRTESLRVFLHNEAGCFGEFYSNPLVNHIGVVCMVETIDGMLVVQKRSKEVTNRGGTLSSSVSGAVNWRDIRSKETQFPINSIAESVFREMEEELGVVPAKNIVFLGLLREYLRGGKPEIYFYAKTEESFEKLKSKWLQAEHKKESTDLIGYEYHSDRVGSDELSRDSFKSRVQEIMVEIGDNANLTLTAGIALSTRNILEKTL